MPSYAYVCLHCDWRALEFYKTLPKDPDAPIECRGCGQKAQRHFAADAGSSVFMGNAKSEGIDSSALAHDEQGKAFFVDNNGKREEVRTVRDIDRFTKDNVLGPPRLIPKMNRETGKTDYVPLRRRDGSIVREKERLIPLGGDKNRSVTSERGEELNKYGTRKSRLYPDPETGEFRTADSFWGDGGAKGYRKPVSGEVVE